MIIRNELAKDFMSYYYGLSFKSSYRLVNPKKADMRGSLSILKSALANAIRKKELPSLRTEPIWVALKCPSELTIKKTVVRGPLLWTRIKTLHGRL